MLSDEIRMRIGQLHSTPWTGAHAIAPTVMRRPPRSAGALAADLDYATLLAHAEEYENASGKHLRFRRALGVPCPAISQTARRRRESGDFEAAGRLHHELAAVSDHFPHGTLFLDLETCGFAGSPLFLIGLVWQAEGSLVVDQLFARHYAEERAVLETLWRVAAHQRVLVTFNGKSFDWPMVHDRSTRHHLGRDRRGQSVPAFNSARAPLTWGRGDPRPELAHCDLLHHARRRWKRVLPNCKLQTLERAICNRSRRDDLSGAQVPVAYHEFVRTGNTRHVGAILHHNALDLLTLVQVTLKLLQPCIGPDADDGPKAQ